MGNFYAKLAFSNVKRSREVYLPYLVATAVISGIYFFILTLLNCKSISGVPGGDTARMIMAMGTALFTAFAFFFMLYVNDFLVKRRKKEFGLYGVLGMNKAQVARVVCFEGLYVIGAGVVAGIVLGIAFGRLLFMLLLKLMNFVGESTFTLTPVAFIGTFALFFAVFIVTSVLNSIRVSLSNPAELLRSDKEGEKPVKRVALNTILGAALLILAYVVAITTENTANALGLFFPDAFLVIIATFLLFKAGSMAVLTALRKNKRLYYKPDNFVAISGMFHRMRANARGLATICILFTMLLVTVAGTSALYLGKEQMTRNSYPMDVELYIHGDDERTSEQLTEKLNELDEALLDAAKANKLTLWPDKSVLVDMDRGYNFMDGPLNGVPVYPDSTVEFYSCFVRKDNALLFNIDGADDEACIEFINSEVAPLVDGGIGILPCSYNSIYEMRREANGLYGGLVFIGGLFAVLFLAGTVLMIYFKQITEGYHDKERYNIMQKVGMDQGEVKRTINKQILWVFFLPLFAAIAHIAAASPMIIRMLKVFNLQDGGLTLACVAVTSLAFALVYLIVYWQTAKVYYRIVSTNNER